MRTQREEILRIIRESGRHMTADEIYRTARETGSRTSIATVYRNLNIMADQKILRRVPVPGHPDCFDITLKEHAHQVCPVCGTVSDAGVGDLKTELEARLGFAIEDYDLCLRTLCPACREKKKQSEPVDF